MELVSVIKNDNVALGSDSAVHQSLVWQHAAEDFNTRSQLIVAESEDALFVREGQVVEVFTGGRYALDTNNYPFLGKLLRAFTGGVSAFHVRVYFVDKSHQLGMHWGTDTPIKLRDPVLKLTTEIQARGGYGFVVTESKKLLLKLIGNNIQNFDHGDLSGFLRSSFIQEIRAAVAQRIREEGREILETCGEPGLIARKVAPLLEPAFDEYGLCLVNFTIEALDVVTDNEERAKLEGAFADRGVMDILGADWGRQRASETLRDLANHPGLGRSGGSPYSRGGGPEPFNALGSALVDSSGQAVSGFVSSVGAPSVAGDKTTTGGDPGIGRRRGSRSAVEDAPAPMCTECRGAVGTGERFCSNCGVPLSADSCSRCGEDLAPGARFCSGCGTAA